MLKPFRALILIFSFSTFQVIEAAPPAKILYGIVWKWFSGKSDSAYYFDVRQHSEIVHRLKDAYQTRRAREFWYEKNMDTFNAGSGNWLGVTDFLGRFQTIRGVCRAGTDMVEQIIGGFIVDISPSGSDSIQFKVHDIKSRWSLFFHLPFINNVPFDNSKTIQRNMSDCHWYFTWKEPVKAALFHQRNLNRMIYKRRKFTGHNF